MSIQVLWAVSEFHVYLDLLQSEVTIVSFSEGEEEWASILSNDKVVGYIWQKHPFAVIENRFARLLDIYPDYMVLEKVDSLSIDEFQVDDDLLKIFSDVELDMGSITMEDLWFNTNSI